MIDSNGPLTVYHYTSLAVLQKIVETGSLWATNVRYLNDVSERDHLIHLVVKRLPIYKKQHPDLDASIFEAIIDRRYDFVDFRGHPYVTSFSMRPDSLSQWRAYCPTDAGVSIGFRADKLKAARLFHPSKIAEELHRPVFYGKVKYVTEHDSAFIDQIISETVTRAMHAAMTSPAGHQPFQYFYVFLDQIASFVKASSFSNEHETRLMVQGMLSDLRAVSFRAAKSCLVPYIQLQIGSGLPKTSSGSKKNSSFIRRVIVGPTANMGLSMQSLSALFMSFDLGVEVKPSQIPFRDL